MMSENFYYYGTGELVCVGDRVIAEGQWYGVVLEIALPHSPFAALMNQFDEGGVLLGENVDGFMMYTFIQPDDGSERVGYYTAWKETKFLERGSIINMQLGGTIAWPYEPGPYGGKKVGV